MDRVKQEATNCQAQAKALLDSIMTGASDWSRFNHKAAWTPLSLAITGLEGATTTEFWREAMMKPARIFKEDIAQRFTKGEILRELDGVSTESKLCADECSALWGQRAALVRPAAKPKGKRAKASTTDSCRSGVCAWVTRRMRAMAPSPIGCGPSSASDLK